MKPIVTYYGGKQKMVKKLLPLIPEHKIYVEPFAGGAALFFAKEKKKIEALNDTNHELINLYQVAQEKKDMFLSYLEKIPYSEFWHTKAVKESPKDDVERAVFFFINMSMGFASLPNAGFGFSKVRNEPSLYFNKLKRLPEAIERLKNAVIFNRDALDIIERFDCQDVFFYCDPPYPNTRQGHYAGYTLEDFSNLVDKLKTIKGSFMLSCYECMEMPKNWERFTFKVFNHTQNTNKGGKRSERKEVIYRKANSLSQLCFF